MSLDKPQRVTDPEVLAAFEKQKPQPVTDPDVLAVFNETPQAAPLKSAGIGLAELYNRIPETGKNLEHLIHAGRAFNQVTNFSPYANKMPAIENAAEMIPEINIENLKDKWNRTGRETWSDKAIESLIKYLPEVASVTKGVYELGKGATNVISGLKSKNIAKAVTEGKQTVKNTYKKMYNDLFEEAEKSGIKNINKPPINTKLIQENSTAKYHDALLNFQKEPTLENAHWAQSDLGKFIRHMEKIESKQGLTSTQYKTLKEAKNAQSALQKEMFNKNKLGGNNLLAEKYNKISAGYANDVVPYTTKSAISDFQAGKISPEKLVEKLSKDYEFMQKFSKQYPGIKLNQFLKSTKGKLLIGGILGGIGLESGKDIYHTLK